MSGFFNIEVTDTFGGEPNYCWVRRYSVPCHDARDGNLAMTRAIKAAAGYSGVRGRSDWHGDSYNFRPANEHVIVMAEWSEIDLDEMGYANETTKL